MTELPNPMTPPDCDLRSLTFMPLEVIRVMQSQMFVKATGDEFKAAFALWCASWLEIPAGSLPNDEQMLEEFSRSKKWKKVREMALRGWVLCSDGRLYHATVCKNALAAWDRRLDYQETNNSKSERQKRWREHVKQVSEQLRQYGITPPRGASLEALEQLLKNAQVDGKASTHRSTVDSVEIGMTETGQGDDREMTGTREDKEFIPHSDSVASPSASPPASNSASNDKTKATRLSKDWLLPKAWGEWALEEKPYWTVDHIRKVAERFRDHWIAKSGADARKLDWQATWRNWVRNEKGPVSAGRPGHGQSLEERQRESSEEAKRILFGNSVEVIDAQG